MTHIDGVQGLPGAVFSNVLGGRVQMVQYRKSSAPIEVQSDSGKADAIASIEQGLVISTTGGSIVIDWCIDGYLEYLNVSSDPTEGPAAAIQELIDVSNLPGWRSLIGSSVTAIGYATVESEAGGEMLWSVRIEVERGASATIVLGDVSDGEYVFQPDNMIAIFDPSYAQSLEVLGSSGTAWGNALTKFV